MEASVSNSEIGNTESDNDKANTELEHDNCTDANEINIHQFLEFDDFESFEQVLRNREQRLGERWVKDKNLKTVERSNRFIVDERKLYKAKFQYSFIRMHCDRSGNYVSRAVAKKSSTKKVNCPVFIRVNVNRKKDKLVVTRCCLEHNHELHLSDRYPSRRRLVKQELECTQVTGDITSVTADITPNSMPFIASPAMARKLIIKRPVFKSTKKSDSTMKSHESKTTDNSEKSITFLHGTPISISDEEDNDATESSAVTLSQNKPRFPGRIEIISPSPNPADIDTKLFKIELNKGSPPIADNDSDSDENFMQNDYVDMDDDGFINEFKSEQGPLTKVSVVNLVERKLRELEKKDSVCQSKHFNYGFTVIERLDMLDRKASFSARKEIDDILLKYLLASNN